MWMCHLFIAKFNVTGILVGHIVNLPRTRIVGLTVGDMKTKVPFRVCLMLNVFAYSAGL